MFESFREEGRGRDFPDPGPDLARRLVDATEAAEFPPASTWWETDPEDGAVDGDDGDGAGRAAGLAAEDAAIERTVGWERLIAFAQAGEMIEIDAAVRRAVERAETAPPHAVGAVDGVGDASAAVQSLTSEYALRWRVADRTATKRVDEAVSLVQGARPAVEAMRSGRITLAHARALADVALGLDPETARQVIETVLAGGELRTPGQMGRAARREALRRDPDHAARRARKAHRERDVTLQSEPDGMATVSAYLPAAEALALYRAVQAHARRVPAHDPGEPDGGRRSIGARRADALTDLVAAGSLIAAGLVGTPDGPATTDMPDPAGATTGPCSTDPSATDPSATDPSATADQSSHGQDEHPMLGALLADEDAWLHDALADDALAWADDETDLDDTDLDDTDPDETVLENPRLDDTDTDLDPDAATDTDTDTVRISDADTDTDTDTDTVRISDADTDAGTDAGTDADTDASTDAGTDADADVRTGVGTELGDPDSTAGLDTSLVEDALVRDGPTTAPSGPSVPGVRSGPAAVADGFWTAAPTPTLVPLPPRALPAARRVEVRVVVSADTLLGLDDAPAEIPGYGPVTATEARRLAAGSDAVLRRILTDPVDGAVLDVGTTRYRPPPSLADHVRDRAVHCGFPGCRMPASACDLDHIAPFDPVAGTGPTASYNIDPDCRHHHRIKGMPGWSVRRDDDGTLVWTTPTGRRFRTLRSPLLPIEPARHTGGQRRSRPDVARDDDPAQPVRTAA